MSFDDADVAAWQGWVGRSATRTERLDPGALRRFGWALGEEREEPPLAHWAYFLPEVPASELDVDGHRRRGGFLPPITLPCRMFAASAMRFEAPLLVGDEATQTSTIRSVTRKRGEAGELVLVEVETRLTQAGVDRVIEVQTIIYRDAGGPTPAPVPAGLTAAKGDLWWEPSTVELFRFSAATFNAHRIHYDLPYATGAEGYPGLVVQGPLTAARLFALARQRRPVKSFTFRAVAPLFQGQPVLLRAGPGGGAFEAVRCDGRTAMTAIAT